MHLLSALASFFLVCLLIKLYLKFKIANNAFPNWVPGVKFFYKDGDGEGKLEFTEIRSLL